MQEVKVTYRRFSWFRYSKRKLIPESFSELTGKQLLFYLRLLAENHSPEVMKLHFANQFFRLPISRINGYKEVAQFEGNEEKKQALIDAWFDNCDELNYLIHEFNFLEKPIEITKNLFPIRRIGFRFFAGPSDEMKNVSIWEYAVAENTLLNYLADLNPMHLHKLAAILYRPISIKQLFNKIFNGSCKDLRIPFRDHMIIKNQNKLKRADLLFTLAIPIFFRSVRNTLPEKYPHIYNGKKKSDDEDGMSWGDVIVKMSKPGEEDKVGSVDFHTFLYRLEREAIDYEKFKRDNESKKSKR